MKISVVIPNYNGRHLLEKNLPFVAAAAKGEEIIVVDDASADKSVAFLKSSWPQIKIVQNKNNLRFAQSCNKGVERARGQVVILLNSDVRPKKDFLAPLISHFKDDQVFSVGAKEISIERGKKTESGRALGEFKKGFLVHWRAKDQTKKDTLWTFGGSMAVSRKKFLALGGFDKDYKPAYWEDIDLCWRARQKGWKILFEPSSVVYHQHETTNTKALGKKKMEAAAFKNQILFMWKNIRGIKLLKHFLWLPYHLIFTSIRSEGLFLLGFFWALKSVLFKAKN